MELRHLRYFVMVAAEMHFGRAAQRLFVSQPALSQQIRSLEAELGFKLFERNRRGVHLTPEGATFLSEAEAVVQQADRAAEVARALAEGGAGHLRLSQLRTMPRGLPERVMAEFQRRHPGVEIIPESGSTEQNVDRLRTAQLVAAFVLAPIEDSTGIGCIEIAPEPIVVALPTGHPLSRRRRIRRRDLRRSVVSLRQGDTPAPPNLFRAVWQHGANCGFRGLQSTRWFALLNFRSSKQMRRGPMARIGRRLRSDPGPPQRKRADAPYVPSAMLASGCFSAASRSSN